VRGGETRSLQTSCDATEPTDSAVASGFIPDGKAVGRFGGSEGTHPDVADKLRRYATWPSGQGLSASSAVNRFRGGGVHSRRSTVL